MGAKIDGYNPYFSYFAVIYIMVNQIVIFLIECNAIYNYHAILPYSAHSCKLYPFGLFTKFVYLCEVKVVKYESTPFAIFAGRKYYPVAVCRHPLGGARFRLPYPGRPQQTRL